MFEDPTIFLLYVATVYVVANFVLGIIDGVRGTNFVLEKKLKQHLDDIIHRVKVEKHNEVFYWYDADDHEFLAQGSSDEEVIAILKARYPTHIFFLPTNHVISEKTEWKAITGPFKHTETVIIDSNTSK